MFSEKIKLVIWDMDETFWHGTLSEEGITKIESNISLVKTLASRGIISSISSKNDYEDVKNKLIEFDLWEYFVFPKINWNPKGQSIKQTIEDMGLRAVNCLFIDDNPTNLEEVLYFCPEINTLDARNVGPESLSLLLLENSSLLGKDDSNLSRLAQYKVLEEKVSERNSENYQSNEEFLRSSEVEIIINYDFMDDIDRVFELIERTNQLNYTKKRLLTDSDRNNFLNKLNQFSYSGATISCKDKFGNYGIVGFYLLKTNFKEKRLEHFVFSCRTMNMGIENFVYNYLGRPSLDIKEPVAYELNDNNIDWIKIVSDFSSSKEKIIDKVNLFVGDCQLLQITPFLGGESFEYVNYADKGLMVRTDCPQLFLGDKKLLTMDEVIMDKLPIWDISLYDDLHSNLPKADNIILSLFGYLLGHYVETKNGNLFRLIVNNFEYLCSKEKELIDSGYVSEVKLTLGDKINLLNRVASFIIKNRKKSANIILLTQRVSSEMNEHDQLWRRTYNSFCYKLNIKYPNVYCMEINKLVDKGDFVDGDHMNRTGYQKLANFVNMIN